MKKILLLFITIIFFITSCRYLNEKFNHTTVADTTITPLTSYNNLFLDSTAIHDFVISDSQFAAFTTQFIDFYKNRNYQYAWFDSATIGEQANHFINLINSSVTELNDSSIYNADLIKLVEKVADTSTEAAYNKSLVLKTELTLTGQFFKYAAKMYKGADVDVSELGWFIPRKKIDLSALLDSTIKSKTKQPEKYAVLNEQYLLLQSYLVKYNAIKKWFNWNTDTVAFDGKPYNLGSSNKALVNAKKRLFALGDLPIADTTTKFDSALYLAVKKFQRRMGLVPTGSIAAKTITELNDSIDNRIRQLMVNMERIRWMPPLPDTAYILVNIPEYKMHVYDSGKWAFDMNVIVGSAANNTVIFSGNLKYIVFSPYWNVPPSIVEKEIVPELKKDPNYLIKHHMEIIGKNGKLPDVRQKPGNDNSLGLVKFLFPNNYNIYLHDTPNRELFTASNRSLSHGCIRVGDPPKLASFLLKNDTTYTTPVIDSLMHLSKEKWVTLNNPVKVFIGYFTSWVNQQGELCFRKDIYGHDAKIADKLFTKK